MKSSAAANLLVIGLIIFMIFIISGIILYPEILTTNNGVSFLGVQEKTSLLYTITFLANALIALWIASKYSVKNGLKYKYITYSLALVGVCYLGLVLTPHTTFSPIHRAFGSSLFALQLITSLIIVFKHKADYLNKLLLILAFLSGLASLYFLFITDGYMFQSQLIFQFAVWFIVIRYLKD